MSFLFKASDLLLQQYQCWPDDLNFLGTTIRHCAITGKVFQAETILKQYWCQLTDESHPFEPLIHSWADFYRQYELTEAEVEPYLETASSLLRQVLSQRRQRYQLNLDYFDEDGEPFLSYTVYLDLPVDDLLALEDQHNDLLLAGHFSSELLHGMIITFEPYPLEKENNG
ncbi:MAG: hypothetical protein SVR94_13420 [Pseudomonadota bacterium]|nr:hypothetical protein [Pseudomonadota bacterium]